MSSPARGPYSGLKLKRKACEVCRRPFWPRPHDSWTTWSARRFCSTVCRGISQRNQSLAVTAPAVPESLECCDMTFPSPGTFRRHRRDVHEAA